jgi:hypothetical protein
MKYIIGIAFGAVVIGVGLSVGVYALFGESPGHFFVKFVAAPAGLIGAGLAFFVYDTLNPKKK